MQFRRKLLKESKYCKSEIFQLGSDKSASFSTESTLFASIECGLPLESFRLMVPACCNGTWNGVVAVPKIIVLPLLMVSPAVVAGAVTFTVGCAEVNVKRVPLKSRFLQTEALHSYEFGVDGAVAVICISMDSFS